MLLRNHLFVVVGMQHNRSLLQLLELTVPFYLKKKDKTLLQTLYIVFALGSYCLFVFDETYLKIFKSYKTTWNDKCELELLYGAAKLKVYKKYQLMLKDFNEIKNNTHWQSYEKGNKLLEFIRSNLSY